MRRGHNEGKSEGKSERKGEREEEMRRFQLFVLSYVYIYDIISSYF